MEEAQMPKKKLKKSKKISKTMPLKETLSYKF